MLDLRSYLAEQQAATWRVERPVSVAYEITALQYALEAKGRRPIVHVAKPTLRDGSTSAMPVITNLTASRVLVARALGLADHRQAARHYATAAASPIAPVIVGLKDAPVQEIVLKGEQADLTKLPALIQHELDPGPYLTASHANTYDPETGTDNTAIQRSWVRGPRSMTWYPYPSSHNYRNLQKFWAKGERCPVVFWIGHHPKVLMGTQAKLAYPASHWHAAGGVIGAPLRLVPSITHGERLMVPADCEIVIEGWAPPGVLEPDGPFGEYTGYMGAQVPAPMVEVTAITMRRNAIYHDYGSGLPDMLVPDNMAMEGKIYELTRSVAPSVVNVHVPVSGRRFHAYLQLKDPPLGEARDALTAALSYRRVKTAIAVDTDIDIFDDSAVMWALATRVQWHRDAIMAEGMSASLLDPSIARGARTTSKAGIDATLAPAELPGAPRPIPPRAQSPAAATEAASKLVDRVENSWPTI